MFIEHTREGYITDICEQNVTVPLLRTAQDIGIELKVYEKKDFFTNKMHKEIFSNTEHQKHYVKQSKVMARQQKYMVYIIASYKNSMEHFFVGLTSSQSTRYKKKCGT